MTDRRTTDGGAPWTKDNPSLAQRRFFSDSPVKTPSRYRSFLLSTLFTFGGDR
ncbi:hypothetical protein SAMN05192571_10692 [Pleomorphomonas diazotrophica]|uniref:hypothetical protein n=1 Tax=Pleomorphomonas diazotrophica TaxID=1166257 RepID=UPI0008EAE58D|nr:hypothetical protein [Pleomorphomonas diazotrophica]SFM79701.1 hypothetical protein SAMN05192571_10692 [Pleomorphomonas diazotrophica]